MSSKFSVSTDVAPSVREAFEVAVRELLTKDGYSEWAIDSMLECDQRTGQYYSIHIAGAFWGYIQATNTRVHA